MTALLKSELIKLRTTRTFVALAAVTLFTSGLLVVLVSTLTEPTEDSVLVDVFISDTSSLFILILAVVGITGEWRHRTITSSLLAAPDRLRFLAAKTLAFEAAGALLSVLVSIFVAILGVSVLSFRDLPLPDAGDVLAQDLRNAMVAALLAAFGVGLGALVRNQVVAIVGVLATGFIVEVALLGLVPDVGRFGPVLALPGGVNNIDNDPDLLAPGLAALAMLGWIALTYVAGAVLLQRRDLD